MQKQPPEDNFERYCQLAFTGSKSATERLKKGGKFKAKNKNTTKMKLLTIF